MHTNPVSQNGMVWCSLSILLLSCSVMSYARTSSYQHSVPMTLAPSPPIYNITGIPSVYVSGTHYEIGYDVGSEFAANIRSFLNASSTFQQLLAIANTTAGAQSFKLFVTTATTAYPDLADEIRGTADGAGVDVNWLWLLNLQDELINVADEGGRPVDEACSDIHVNLQNSAGPVLLSHNEDNEIAIGLYAYIVHATITASGLQYTAYTYPGGLPGNAYGFNSNGVVITTNAVFPNFTEPFGLGRNIVNRNLLEAVDVDDAISRACVPNLANGFSANFASTKTLRSVNVEVAYNASVVSEINGTFYHFNMYKVLDVAQFNDTSTIARQNAADSLPLAVNVATSLNILGDTSNATWPIFRSGAPPDCCATLSTVVFDLRNQTATIFIRNPKFSPPLTVMSIAMTRK